MKLFVCPNNRTEKQLETARYCVDRLEQLCGADCFMSEENSVLLFGDDSRAAESPLECDMVVAIGGDGSVLRAARCAVQSKRPLVGINSGRLGYLCAIDLSEMERITPGYFAMLTASHRSMLSFAADGVEHIALNDVIVAKSNFGATVDLEVFMRGERVAHWRGDGVLISTPTGSTSYNLSAGGPVLQPDTGCFAITPVCAHSLDSRAIVVNDIYPITVALAGDSDKKACVYADGVMCAEITGSVEVKRCGCALELLVNGKGRPDIVNKT